MLSKLGRQLQGIELELISNKENALRLAVMQTDTPEVLSLLKNLDAKNLNKSTLGECVSVALYRSEDEIAKLLLQRLAMSGVTLEIAESLEDVIQSDTFKRPVIHTIMDAVLNEGLTVDYGLAYHWWHQVIDTYPEMAEQYFMSGLVSPIQAFEIAADLVIVACQQTADPTVLKKLFSYHELSAQELLETVVQRITEDPIDAETATGIRFLVEQSNDPIPSMKELLEVPGPDMPVLYKYAQSVIASNNH